MLYPIQRQELHWAHMQLVKNNLAVWTSGNVSMRLPSMNAILIKPSGVLYEDLSPDKYVVVGFDGGVVEGDLKPSTDTLSHLYLYKTIPAINAVVHTHSPYATAASTLGLGIRCLTTEQADVFGGFISCALYTDIGTDAMGEAAEFTLRPRYIGGVLLANHGALTTGRCVKEAVRNAIMLEHCAKIDKIAGENAHVLDGEKIKQNHTRYSTSYGQL